MTKKEQSSNIADQMLAKDAFSKWLGIELLEISPGYCVLQLSVREEMLNGFGIAHGGITFSLADSAFAFASNSQGRKAVSIEASVAHTRAVMPGDLLTATAEEENLGNKLANYRVNVVNQRSEVVALFKGTVFRKKEEW